MIAESLKLTMPLPPSLNSYYRTVNGRPIISKEGRLYRIRVCMEMKLLRLTKLNGRLDVRIEIYPPDKRRMDLDNRAKCLLDALQHAGVYADDSQIDRLLLVRMPVKVGGQTLIEITEF